MKLYVLHVSIFKYMQRPEKASDTLALELQGIVGNTTWVWMINLSASARAVLVLAYCEASLQALDILCSHNSLNIYCRLTGGYKVVISKEKNTTGGSIFVWQLNHNS